MKLWLKFICFDILCFLALINPTRSSGENGAELRVDVAPGFPGSMSQVPITLLSTGQVVGVQFDVAYSTELSPGAFVAGNLGANYNVRSRQIAPGVLRYLVYSSQNLPLPTNAIIGIQTVSLPVTETNGSSLVPGGLILAKADGSQFSPAQLSSGGVVVAPVFRAVDGTILLLFHVQINHTYVIQATTNFINWVNISTNIATTNYITMADNDAINLRYRFYRWFQPAVVPPWVISNVTWQAGNKINFQVSGEPGKNFIVQASTNLATWVNILTNTLGSSPVPLTDTNAINFHARFYRIMETN